MNKTLQKDIDYLETEAVRIFKAATPVDTGNQRSKIYSKRTKTGFMVIVNTDYAEYTTDPWTKGDNPNEGWEKEAGKLFIKKARNRLNKYR